MIDGLTMDTILSALSESEREKLGGLSEAQLWAIVRKQALREEKQMEEASKQLQFLLAAGGWEGMASRATALLERRALKIHFIGGCYVSWSSGCEARNCRVKRTNARLASSVALPVPLPPIRKPQYSSSSTSKLQSATIGRQSLPFSES